jgi:hypothetical protein
VNLQTSLLQEYRSHTAFSFDDVPLNIDEGSVWSFNDAYLQLSRYKSQLSASLFDHASARCVELLSHLFDVLRPQVIDQRELRFLDELAAESGRLLREEIAFMRLSAGRFSGGLTDSRAFAHARELEREHCVFGRLDPVTLNSILKLVEPTVADLRQASAAGRLTRDDLSVVSGPVVRRIRRILNRWYAQQGILDAVSAYSGCRMSVSGLAIELSVPQSGWWKNQLSALVAAPRTLYAHLDESIGHPKSIVYLSDVEKDQGPTCVYPQAYQGLGATPLQELVGRIVGRVGFATDSPLHSYYARQYHQSMSSENFRRHFMRLPEEMRFNSHFGWDVLPGGKVESYLVEREKQMLGLAGTFIVFDGARLLHRGGLMHHGERFALQVIFSDAHIGRKIVRRLRRAFYK